MTNRWQLVMGACVWMCLCVDEPECKQKNSYLPIQFWHFSAIVTNERRFDII